MMQRVARATSLTTRHALAVQRQRQCAALPPLQSITRLADIGSSSSRGAVRFKVTVPRASADTRKRLKPKLSKDKFAALTTAFFERVTLAVAPLQPMNDDFALETASDGVLTIRTDAKAFELKVIPAKQQLEFTSPVSGVRVYAWNQRTQRWEDENDAHDLEGLLTRDLMRHCSGVPAF